MKLGYTVTTGHAHGYLKLSISILNLEGYSTDGGDCVARIEYQANATRSGEREGDWYACSLEPARFKGKEEFEVFVKVSRWLYRHLGESERWEVADVLEFFESSRTIVHKIYDGRLRKYVNVDETLPPDVSMWYDLHDATVRNGCFVNVAAVTLAEAQKKAMKEIAELIADNRTWSNREDDEMAFSTWLTSGKPMDRICAEPPQVGNPRELALLI